MDGDKWELTILDNNNDSFCFGVVSYDIFKLMLIKPGIQLDHTYSICSDG